MTKQVGITHIPKSVLAMVGIVGAIVQLAVALPLHIGAYLRVEYGIVPLLLLSAVQISWLSIFMVFSLTQMNKQKEIFAQVAALRKEVGFPRWLFSMNYWDAQSKFNAPYAPVWLRRIQVPVFLYALSALLLDLYLIQLDFRADRSLIPEIFLQLTTSALAWSLFHLPVLVSIWRERRMQSGQAAQSGADHAA